MLTSFLAGEVAATVTWPRFARDLTFGLSAHRFRAEPDTEPTGTEV